MILRKINANMDEEIYIENIRLMNQVFLDDLNENNGVLPPETPVEIHPYINEFQLQDYDKYIIGTFPPISYVRDKLNIHNNIGNIPNRPRIPFYHGNVCDMWRLMGINNLENILELERIQAKNELINFLNIGNINYCDIIYSTKRNEYSSKDKHLKNIVVNEELIKHIFNNKNVNRLLFNTGSPLGITGLKIHVNNVQNGFISRINVTNAPNSFDLFIRACQDLGFKVEFKIDDFAGNIILDWTEVNIQNANTLNHHLKTKIIFKAKITIPVNDELLQNGNEIIKEFIIVTPFSPAARESVDHNPIVNNWRAANNMENRQVLLELIYSAFVNFNEENIQFLYNLNFQHN